MFAISALALIACWSSAAVSEGRADGGDGPALTQQDDQPPEGLDVDQDSEHRRHEPPTGEEGDGARRWNKARHEHWRNFRDGHEPVLSPDMIETAMGVLEEKLPHYYQEMTKLRGEDSAKFERAMKSFLPVVMEYLEVRNRDQKLADSIIEEFKIEHQLRELSKEYKAAEDATEKQAACEEQIRKLVRQQFELRLVWQEARLKEFAERLERQRQELERERQNLEQRRAKLDELVASRVEEVKSGKMGGRFHHRGQRHGASSEPGGRPQGVRGQGLRLLPPEVRPPSDRPPADATGPRPPAHGAESGDRPHPPTEPRPDSEEEAEE